MVPQPRALALTLCDRVIIEQGTKNPTLVGIFLNRSVEGFPSEFTAFSAFAPVTDGLGDGTIELVAIRLETDEQIYSQRGRVSFPDRFTVVNIHFRVSKLRFPAPGSYVLVLLIDGEVIAQRRLRAYQREGPS